VPGELCIGGAGVGIGYLNNQAMTEQAFIDSPFTGSPFTGSPFASSAAGEKLYRTGDLVRYRADGNLEFIARIDGQVKIRGFRIELGEIEAKLKQQPSIKDAVVADKKAPNGQTVLVAYLLSSDQPGNQYSEFNAQALRSALKQQLPDYMVPAAYLSIDQVPLTPNGKIDRKSLPAPEGDAFGSQEYVAPEGETEIALTRIWAELLGVEKVGRIDNFFELGGNSLIASQAIAQSQQTFEVEIDLRKLFENPTISESATLIQQAVNEKNLLLTDEEMDLADDDEEEFLL
jgi:acyl carrier protein